MYSVIYNRKGQIYEMSDIAEMLDLAITMTNEFSSLTEITIYVNSKDCITSWLDCVPGIKCSQNDFTYNSLSGRICTPKTYKRANVESSEIIIAPCAQQADLEKIQDSLSIAAVLVIPEMEGQCDKWLLHHSAINFQTNAEFPNNLHVTELENRVIGYLKYEGVMMQSLSDFKMVHYIQRQANILRMKRVDSSYDAIYKQSLLRGLSHKDAHAVANIIGSNKSYNLGTKVNYEPLIDLLNDCKWENN